MLEELYAQFQLYHDYINHKISLLLKITGITLKIIFSNEFSRSIIDF